MKPQDVVVALSLAGLKSKPAYAALAHSLALSTSETHAAVARLTHVGLLNLERDVVVPNLLEFLIHGIRYAFPAVIGGPTLGMPTGAAAIESELSLPELGPWVWPWPDGTHRGVALEPLYATVPRAALQSRRLYELLALVDLLRAGRARERSFAARRLKELLT